MKEIKVLTPEEEKAARELEVLNTNIVADKSFAALDNVLGSNETTPVNNDEVVYENMSRDELKALATEKGIKFYKSIPTVKLIALLKEVVQPATTINTEAGSNREVMATSKDGEVLMSATTNYKKEGEVVMNKTIAPKVNKLQVQRMVDGKIFDVLGKRIIADKTIIILTADGKQSVQSIDGLKKFFGPVGSYVNKTRAAVVQDPNHLVVNGHNTNFKDRTEDYKVEVIGGRNGKREFYVTNAKGDKGMKVSEGKSVKKYLAQFSLYVKGVKHNVTQVAIDVNDIK